MNYLLFPPVAPIMADEPNYLEITPRVRIPMEELHITYTRSSGPGGQHVNKTSTKAELTFDLAHSPSLSQEDRLWLISRLESRLDSEGILRISSQEFRSQLRNKKAAIEKLHSILERALERPKSRKKSRPTAAAREKRLQSKKISSEKKKRRLERFSI